MFWSGWRFIQRRSARCKFAQRLKKGKIFDAWYDAVVHLQSTLSKPSDRLSRVVSQRAFTKAGSGLLTGKQLVVSKARKVKFAMAKTDYDEGRFRSAIDRLNAIALEHQPREGNESVHLVLDSTEPSMIDGLIQAASIYKPEFGVTAKIRKEIKPIVDAAKQQALDELALAAAVSMGRRHRRWKSMQRPTKAARWVNAH